MSRYTLYTGEPITVGFMRLAPGKAFWGWLFTIIGFAERGLPGWALRDPDNQRTIWYQRNPITPAAAMTVIMPTLNH